jgi:hypothetical protein
MESRLILLMVNQLLTISALAFVATILGVETLQIPLIIALPNVVRMHLNSVVALTALSCTNTLVQIHYLVPQPLYTPQYPYLPQPPHIHLQSP